MVVIHSGTWGCSVPASGEARGGKAKVAAVIPDSWIPQPHISGSMYPTHPSAMSSGTGKVVGIRAQWEALPSRL